MLGSVVTAQTGFGSTTLPTPVSTPFNLGNGVDAGDQFVIITFDVSTSNAAASDTYRIWTDPSWIIPADGSVVTFGTEIAQLSGAGVTATFTKIVQTSVIPEPSSFAALAGLVVVGAVATRRRRSA